MLKKIPLLLFCLPFLLPADTPAKYQRKYPRTMIFSRGQYHYNPVLNYGGRWADRPLLVDPELNDPHPSGTTSIKALQAMGRNTAMYGLDGLASLYGKGTPALIRQLEKAADQMHLWAFMGNDALHKRAFSMEKRIERMRTTEKPTKAKKMNAQFASREFRGDEVLQLRGLTKSFGDRTLLSDVYLRVEPGERIALLGENGTGKTTLLNMIVGQERPDSGSIRLGPAVVTAYLPQIIRFAHPERSLLDTMLYEKKGMTAQSARNRLAQYQFQGEDVFKSVSALSGGELSRLRLCMLMDEQTSFLILDEPTNHLDIAAREWVEEAVEAFDGTLLFVSHDRYFINRFATRIWELADGTITDYPMGFTQYQAVKAQEKQERTPAPVREKKGDTRPAKGNRSQQAARRQLTICENTISKLETEIADLDGQMQQVGRDPDKLAEVYAKKMETENTLQEQMARWEELSLQLEE